MYMVLISKSVCLGPKWIMLRNQLLSNMALVYYCISVVAHGMLFEDCICYMVMWDKCV